MLIYIYMLLVLVTGCSALYQGAVYAGISGIVGPTLCWFAASGLKGSLVVGTPSQRIVGLVSALACLAIGVGIVYHSGFWVGFFGYEIGGVAWCVIGLIVGWLATTRKVATGT